jgi:hypothetical protein
MAKEKGMHFEGTPSDELAEVLATGETSARWVLISCSGREPTGRDAEYIEWHSLDHRPEQYRLPKLRHSLRMVSTPECRAVRAASEGALDSVDHVMTYMFADAGEIPGFVDLGQALHRAGRMPLLLPSICHMAGSLAGKTASPRAVVGADVIPWRPALGIYVIVEEGHATPADLVDVPGVAGVWWYAGEPIPDPFSGDSSGRQITYCFLDEDPVAVGAALGDRMRRRWREGNVRGLLAAPFHVISPFDWDRHLP